MTVKVQLGAPDDFYTGTNGQSEYFVRTESATTLMLHTALVECASIAAKVVTATNHGFVTNNEVRFAFTNLPGISGGAGSATTTYKVAKLATLNKFFLFSSDAAAITAGTASANTLTKATHGY